MRERELRAAAICGLCQKKIGDSGLPVFYRVRIERHGVKLDAVRRQAGLEMMMNGHVSLAQALSPDEDMTIPLMDPIELTICEPCSTSRNCCVAMLAETTPMGGHP